MKRVVTCLAIALIALAARPDAYDPPANYYSSATGTGTTLKSQLHNIIDNHTFYSYDAARSILQVTDRAPNDPSNIILVYDRTSLDVSGLFASGIPGWDSGVSWNREHVWPRSRGVDSSGDDNSDLHNLRPSDPQVNEDRLNFNFGGAYGQPYGLVNDGGQTYWYPGDADAGMIARQAFYMAVRYDGSDSLTTNLELTNGNPGAFGTTMGNLARLIEWHYRATPDDFERRRNDVIYDSYQGNRNPFVDRPEYAWSVFVNQANNSRITLAGGTTSADPSQSTLNLDLGTILVGTSPAGLQQQVTLNKAGNDGTYYEVTAVGDATSSIEGRFNAFQSSATDSETFTVGLAGNTSAPGTLTGSVVINNLDITTGGGTGRGANDADDLINLQFTVLDHINGSFSGVSDLNNLTLDFGQVTQGSAHPGIVFALHNLETFVGFTAAMDIDTPIVFGDSELSVTGLSGTVAGGASIQPIATIDTANVGSYSAVWQIKVSDPDLPGETTQTLVLGLVGEVVAAAIAGDADNDGDIDDADLAVSFSNYTGPVGASGNKTQAQGDNDGDGDVDDGDLAISFSGYTGPLGPGVPEPASALMLGIVATLTLRRVRRAA